MELKKDRVETGVVPGCENIHATDDGENSSVVDGGGLKDSHHRITSPRTHFMSDVKVLHRKEVINVAALNLAGCAFGNFCFG